jgi:cell fate (sporulation/competence/biofilm development) regulator YlbF (YheA/YmcA/DUF963 family)
MTKPKDRTGEFMRQHKRILEERNTLLTKIDHLETTRAVDIAKAAAEADDRARILAEEVVRLATENTTLKQTNASQVDCIEVMKTQLADRQADIERLMLKLENTAPEFKRLEEEHAKSLTKLQDIHNAELATLRADIDRMDELAKRIEERGKKHEQAEASALLNRKLMGKVIPSRNYRG